MEQQQQSQTVRIGLFTLIAFALFTVAILAVGRKTGYFANYYRLVGEFQGVKGLTVGQPVWLVGVNVGIVEKIQLTSEGEGIVRVILTVETQYRDFIKEDSVALLETKGLLGDKIVNITIGSNDARVLEDGEQILTQEPVELGDVIEQVGGVLGSLKSSLENVEEVIAGLAEGEGTVGKLVKDDTLHDSSVRVLDNLNQTIETINKGKGTLGRLLAEDSIYNEIEAIIGKIDRGEGTLGKLLNSDEIHTNLVDASQAMDTLFAKAATGEGSVGKIMMKEEFHDALVTLLKDIKENPGRYVNVSVFGGRKK